VEVELNGRRAAQHGPELSRALQEDIRDVFGRATEAHHQPHAEDKEAQQLKRRQRMPRGPQNCECEDGEGERREDGHGEPVLALLRGREVPQREGRGDGDSADTATIQRCRGGGLSATIADKHAHARSLMPPRAGGKARPGCSGKRAEKGRKEKPDSSLSQFPFLPFLPSLFFSFFLFFCRVTFFTRGGFLPRRKAEFPDFWILGLPRADHRGGACHTSTSTSQLDDKLSKPFTSNNVPQNDLPFLRKGLVGRLRHARRVRSARGTDGATLRVPETDVRLLGPITYRRHGNVAHTLTCIGPASLQRDQRTAKLLYRPQQRRAAPQTGVVPSWAAASETHGCSEQDFESRDEKYTSNSTKLHLAFLLVHSHTMIALLQLTSKRRPTAKRDANTAA
jgi:hypothetical protein